MKRVGIIDNLLSLPSFLEDEYARATAEEVMAATGGNTGNVAFVHGVRKVLANPLRRIEWATPSETINRELDHVVICCANQLGPHVDLQIWADKLAEIDKPISLIGLGAQADDRSAHPQIPEGTQRFLQRVVERRAGGGPNIAVRGEFTRGVLAALGIDSVPAGCPSLHISPVKDLGQRILERQLAANVERVAVAAGNPWEPRSAQLEPTLVEIVDRWRGEYVLQHPVMMFQYAYGQAAEVSEAERMRMQEIYGGRFNQESLEAWYRRYACAFIDVPNWMRFLQKFDLVVGPRYHGVALGLQAGIPGCVITIDARTEELCEGTGVKALSLDEAVFLDAASLVRRAEWTKVDAENFDSTRRQKSRLLEGFIVGIGLEPSLHS